MTAAATTDPRDLERIEALARGVDVERVVGEAWG